MKILQLVTRRQYRGAEVFAANLSATLIAEGHQVIFAGLYKAKGENLSVEHALNIDLGEKKNPLGFVQILIRLITLINKEKPDIIQANGSDTLKFAVIARYAANKLPIVYRNISIISSWMGEGRLKKFFYQFLFNRVNHVTSVGEHSKSDLIDFFNFPESKITVIRRGIPVISTDKKKSRAIIVNEFKLKDSDKIVMHVGNFSKEKNHQFLLDAFKLIGKDHSDIKLLLLGNGELFDQLKEQVRQFGLQHMIFFAGFRKDPQALLSGADLLVLCSLVEGVPGVILEAAAQRVPVLAVNVGGISEVVRSGETGLLISTHDVSLFADHLINLLYDPERIRQYGNHAYDLVCNEYDPKRNAQLFVDLYRRLIHDCRED